jgi:hypothetical protein
LGVSAGGAITTGSKNVVIGQYNGNQGGLDIRTSNNYIVLSDGDGNPRAWHDGTEWNGIGGGGAGYFLGENGATGDTTNGLGDIFRVHEDTLNTNVTIASGNNALCAGPLTIATGVTLTVNGNLSIV